MRMDEVAGGLEPLWLIPKRRRPRQPHPGTRIIRYRCFLPDLAEFANYRRGGTDGATIDVGC